MDTDTFADETQWQVLDALYQLAGGRAGVTGRIKDLAAQVEIEQSEAERLIGKLQEKGLVARMRDVVMLTTGGVRNVR